MDTAINKMLHDAAVEIEHLRTLQATAEQEGTSLAWADVLDEPRCWSVRHDSDHSVVHMSQEEIEQSVVEDLLFVYSCASRGAAGTYPVNQPYHYLGSQTAKFRGPIAQAVETVVASGMALRDQNHGLSLNPAMFKQAQDFSGVYVPIGPVEGDDLFDTLIATGGSELVADTFEDVAVQLDKPAPRPPRASMTG